MSRLRVRVTTPYLDEHPAAGGAGRGLAGMRGRVEALGGTLVAQREGDLFVVEADLPRGRPVDSVVDGPVDGAGAG